MTVYFIRPKDDPAFVGCSSWEEIREMIEECEAGEEWIVKIDLMDEAAFEALPDFDGW